MPAGVAEPWDADALSGRKIIDVASQLDDAANNLVTRDDGGSMWRQFAVDDMQVGPADAAREDANQHLAWPGLRN